MVGGTGILQAVARGTMGGESEDRRATGYMGPGRVGEEMGAYAGDDKESCGKVADQADTSGQMGVANA